MADQTGRTDPFSDIISLVAGPIAAVIRSFDQLRKGADELMKGLENFNRTMTNLNDTAERVNALLSEIEQPVRAMLPQVTRTVKFADEFSSRMSGPMEQVIPGLVRLSETLNSPVITSLPNDLTSFVDAINDLVKRLSPLGQIAESAGGLFGLRIPGMSRSASAPATPAPTATPAPAPVAVAAEPAPVRAKKAPAKKRAPVKKAPAKKSAPKKAAAKKAPAKKR
jgi:ABC-type transporter Mla subunit MlaD